MRYFSLSLAAALALAPASPAAAQSMETMLQESTALMRAVSKHKEALSDVSLKQPNCDETDIGPFEAAISDIIQSSPTLNELSARGDRMATEIVSGTANVVLSIGDTSLKANCVRQADIAYRAVLRSYPGSGLSAARQRAQVGIEDVRQKKK